MTIQHARSSATTVTRLFAMVAAGGFAFVALFQLAIVLGAPFGMAASRGKHWAPLTMTLTLVCFRLAQPGSQPTAPPAGWR